MPHKRLRHFDASNLRGLHLQQRFRKMFQKAGFESNWYLVVLAAGIGTVTACGALGFMWLLEHAEMLFLHWPPFASHEGADSAGLPWWLIIAAPVVGAAICGVLVYYGAPEAKGHGVPEVIIALHRKKGNIRPRVALIKSIASAITIGSGGSAGAEGPIVQIGSAIGSNIGRILRINPEHTGTLLGCGAAAGIASVFNAPIAGIFFVMEVLLRDFSVRTFTPIVIASVFSAATTQAVLGENNALFAISGDLSIYEFGIAELPFYLVLGLICGLVATIFIKSLDSVEQFYSKLNLHGVLKPISGAAMLGVTTVFVMMLLHKAGIHGENGVPPYYANGYAFIKNCLDASFYTNGVTGLTGSTMFVLILLFLAALKLMATCFTLGSGGSGGILAPSLFLGAATGGAFGVLVNQIGIFGGDAVSPAAYALVGMAAMMAGTTHGPLTAILLLFEITGDYKVILPIMLAAVLSTVVAQIIMGDSIYSIAVHRRGIRFGTMSDFTILRRIPVSQVPMPGAVTVQRDDPAQRLLVLAEAHHTDDFVVVDDNNRYVGMVTGNDLRTTLLQIEALPLLVVAEIMRTDIPVTHPEETLDVVMDKFSTCDSSSLAVIDGPDPATNQVVGVITRHRMMRQYHKALEHH